MWGDADFLSKYHKIPEDDINDHLQEILHKKLQLSLFYILSRYCRLWMILIIFLRIKWARPWENVSYAICEQQRRRSACASAQSDQHLCCSLPRQNDTSSLYIRNFKILAGYCSWAGQFVSCLVGDSRRHIFSWRGSNIINRMERSSDSL